MKKRVSKIVAVLSVTAFLAGCQQEEIILFGNSDPVYSEPGGFQIGDMSQEQSLLLTGAALLAFILLSGGSDGHGHSYPSSPSY